MKPVEDPKTRGTAAAFWIYLAAICCLAVPGLLTLADIALGPGDRRQESVARTPDLSLQGLKRLPGDLRFYIKNRYAIKDAAIAMASGFKGAVFGALPYPKVISGDDGFLFLSNEEAMDYHQAVALFSDAERYQWAVALSRIESKAKASGAEYLFVLAPDKHTVYADKLPGWANAAAADRRRGDQLLDTLDLAGVRYLDLRPVFLDARSKNDVRLFHKTDTHWNSYGASVAASAIAAEFGIGGKEAGPATSIASPRGGDLARMIGRMDRMPEEIFYVAEPRAVECVSDEGLPVAAQHLDPFFYARAECNAPDAPVGVALIFMDSYGVALQSHLAPRFRRSIFVWGYGFDAALIDHYKPDYVIEEIVERKLQTLSTSDVLLRNAGCRVDNGGDSEETVLLLGNSLLHDHSWKFGDKRTVNCGFQGHTASQFTAKLDWMAKDETPAQIVIAFGTVELVIHASGEEDEAAFLELFREEFSTFLQHVRARWPKANIVVNSAPGIDNTRYAGADVDAATIEKANAIMKAVTEEAAARFVDVGAALADTPDPAYDGVHLSLPAYDAWSAAIFREMP
jgi:alginate O-acetyltransferase complex protein AlgJ